MKKYTVLFTFLFTLILLFALLSCEQPTLEIFTAPNYFADIEASKTSGTENTEFIFEVLTNDFITNWVIDGIVVPIEYAKSATGDNELIYSFSSGTHIIGVVTENGATDEVEIFVDPVEIVFRLSAISGDETTEIYFDYPILTIEGESYDIQNMESNDFVTIIDTETHRFISLKLGVGHSDSFLFINNNAQEVYDIDLQNMSATDLHKVIELFYPERLEPVEEIIPFYSETRFSISGHNEAVSDYLSVFDEYAVIGGETIEYTDNAMYDEEIRIVILSIGYDSSDSFFFVNGNFENFFGLFLDDLSYSDLIIACDILNRYPEEGIIELMEVY